MDTVEYRSESGTWRQSAWILLVALFIVALLGSLIALLSRLLTQESTTFLGAVLLVLLGLLPMLLVALAAFWIAARFVQRFYALPKFRDSMDLFEYLLTERPEIPPTVSLARQGKIQHGDVILERYGGPGEMFVTSDSAVIFEKAGKITRLVRGPALVEVDHFEKVWDVLELRPHRWVFSVGAITRDGIPITYDTDVRFQIDLTGTPEEQEAAIWKAATCKWIRDAWRTEPDRLMIWPKRVIISATEGNMRTILARYDLDQLLDEAYRAEIQQALITALTPAVGGMGVRLLGVELGNIKLGEQILQQWIATWRAEKERAMHVRIAEGMAHRARVLEEARTSMQKQILGEAANTALNLRQNAPASSMSRSQGGSASSVSVDEAKQELRRQMLSDLIARLQKALDNDEPLPSEVCEGAAEASAEASAEQEKLFSQLVLLSCIEVIKQTAFNLDMFLPNDVMSVLDSVQKQLGCKSDVTKVAVQLS